MKNKIALAVILLSSSAIAAPKAVVTSDHDDALYSCGENVVFTVKITDGEALVPTGTVQVVVDNFGSWKLVEKTFDLAAGNPFAVPTELAEPGFVRLRVQTENGKGIPGGMWGVGFDVTKIRPTTPDPVDFDAYWASEKARLEKEVPLAPTRVKDEKLSNGSRTVYRVSFATFSDKRVYGFLSVPTKPGKYPVRIHVPGYGPWCIFSECAGSKAVGLHMNVHHFDPPATQNEMIGLCGEAEKARKAALGVGYLPLSGLDVSREAYYYHDVMLGINRAVDWACLLPEADASNLTYGGMSQGGAFGLYLAYLNGRFTRIEVAVTALTDMFGCKNGRQSGWPQPIDGVKDADLLARREKIAPYFDGVNFARRLKTPAMFIVGFNDGTCAPHAVYAAYNVVPAAEKTMYNALGEGHMAEIKPKTQKAIAEWFAK